MAHTEKFKKDPKYNTRNQYYMTPFIRHNYEKLRIMHQVPNLLNKLPRTPETD